MTLETGSARDRIAADLAKAYATGPGAVSEAFARHLAPQVEIAHEPAQPQDGVYDRATLVAAQAGRVTQFLRVMPDYREVAAISAATSDGDEIVVDLTITGTLPDGSAVAIHGNDRLIVTGAEITTMISVFESQQMGALVAALNSR